MNGFNAEIRVLGPRLLSLAGSFILGLAFLMAVSLPARCGQAGGASHGARPNHLGGRHSVGGRLNQGRNLLTQAEHAQSPLKPYWDFKDRVKSKWGLDFGLDYNAIIQLASHSPGRDAAASGALRFLGRWDLLGRGSANRGTLVYKVENRHLLGANIPPQKLGGEVGYSGLTAVPFSGMGWALTNLFWEQHLWHSRVIAAAGVVDVTDYVNTYSFSDPWSGFYNLAFATDPTIPAPDQGLGAALQVMPARQIYVLAGMADANGNPTRSSEAWNSFWGQAEYFKHIEVGWVKSLKRRFTDNIHLTAWQADQRGQAGVRQGWGLAFSCNRLLAGKWEPFLRAAFANDGGALWERSVALGLGRGIGWKNSQAALGLSWGRPSEDTLGPGLGDQYTVELFLRMHPAPHLTVTPDLQLLINPAENQSENMIAIFGLWARLSL